MARPLKQKSERKNTDLRIPLTESQKNLIARATELAEMDMASWARPILLKEAQAIVDRDNAGATPSK